MKKLHSQRTLFRRSFHGFTLIELLVVMMIIAVLAALTISAFSYAQNAASRNRTLSFMAAIKGGLEQYKEKWGEYPEPVNETATSDFAGSKIATGPAMMLYQALTGDGNNAIKTATTGSAISDGLITAEEAANGVAAGLPKSMILQITSGFLFVDGFGRPLQYKKGTTTAGAAAVTINPNYDLWSYGSAKRSAEMNDSLKASAPDFWITNWK